MARPPAQPAKKQQSLTSFFSPKSSTPAISSPAATRNAGPRDIPSSSPSGPREPTIRKRPLVEDAGRINNGPSKSAKRVKSTSAEAPSEKLDDDDLPPTSIEPAARAPLSTPTASSRTGQYLFGSSPAPVEDEETRLEKDQLHRRFVQKLGNPDSVVGSRFRRDDDHALDGDANGEDGDQGEEEEEERPAPSKTKKTKGGKTKLTPMEIQFLDIKRKHMDTVLIVEVGYKFRFFGEDARIAAKELSIVCIPGKFRYDEHPSEAHIDRFASASIPVHRLPVHAKRLVAAGHKVGVVRQIETAALKKAGDNRNAPFVRKLTNVYTKGTYIDEIGELDQSTGNSDSPSGGYLLCITETATSKGLGADEKVDVAILAVQPATGDIIYDGFEDGFMRSEIETRLLHIAPCEFLIVGELTKATDKLIQHLSGSTTNVFGDKSRVERIPRTKTMATESHSHVTQFYADKLRDSSESELANSLLEKVLHLPEQVTICLSSMITHLTEYGLEHIFDLTKYFQSFSTRSNMLVSGTTLESLEIYRNATDHSDRGSLMWALDKTRTRFGQRLLRKWIGRPLLDRQRLEERLAAVEELRDKLSSSTVSQLESLLGATKTDLERSLIRIYYGKCSRSELLSVLQTLQRVATHFSRVKEPADTGFEASLLSGAICALPSILDIVVGYLDKINADAARKNDAINFFREEELTDDIQNHLVGIASVEVEIDDQRQVAAQKLGKKTPVSYATVSGIEYLIEVSNTDIKRVPASWVKISGTKKLSRFHTPEILRLISERDQHKESLAAACESAFKDLLRSLAADYQPLRDAVSALSTLDCLLSLAKVASLPGYSKPTFLPSDNPPTISVVAGRHPMAEHLLPDGYIPFTTTLSSPAPLAHLITGPNMGGKSSFVRAAALLVLLAQIGSFVPAQTLKLTLVDGIYTRMGARDNLFTGESTFMVEVTETARILRAATPRSLVILDELGRGTSTHDGAAIAHAVLNHVVRETRCLTLFITHYQNLARVADGLGGLVQNVHMRFNSNRPEAETDNPPDEPQEDDIPEEITFLYEVAPGVAHRSYGLNVARLARLPSSIINVAAKQSRALEHNTKARRLRAAAQQLTNMISDPSRSDLLEQLVEGIEQL